MTRALANTKFFFNVGNAAVQSVLKFLKKIMAACFLIFCRNSLDSFYSFNSGVSQLANLNIEKSSMEKCTEIAGTKEKIRTNLSSPT